MKMRAAVLEEFGQPLVVREVDLAEPKQGEVLYLYTTVGKETIAGVLLREENLAQLPIYSRRDELHGEGGAEHSQLR